MRVAIFCVLSLVAGAASAQTFRAGTKLVQIDVIATSKGAPAKGLTKDDFTVLDNGKPQKIAFFSVRTPQTSAAALAPLPAGAVSNRMARDGESSAHATILLIDHKNTSRVDQAFAVQRVIRFVQMRRGRDRIGIYTFMRDGSVQVAQELTDNAELLSRAANSLKALDPSSRSLLTEGMTEHAAESYVAINYLERAMDTKYALKTIARHLAGVPGRKSLIWVTTAFPLMVPSVGLDFRPDMEEAARSLNDANVALYAVDARGLQGALSGLTAIPNAESAGPQSQAQVRMQMGRGESAAPPGLATEQELARLTGGLVFYNKSNAIEESIGTAANDGEITYTLGFYPGQEEHDGTWHGLKVASARRGVSLRYRENYFSYRDTARESDVAHDRPTLAQLLKDPLDATQLELVADTAPDATRQGFLRVKVNADLHGVELERGNSRWSGEIDVTFFIAGTGKAVTKTLKIDIPDDQFDAFVAKGIDTVESIEIAAGAGALRVVVQDRTTGAAGSVTLPLGVNQK